MSEHVLLFQCDMLSIDHSLTIFMPILCLGPGGTGNGRQFDESRIGTEHGLQRRTKGPMIRHFHQGVPYTHIFRPEQNIESMLGRDDKQLFIIVIPVVYRVPQFLHRLWREHIRNERKAVL